MRADSTRHLYFVVLVVSLFVAMQSMANSQSAPAGAQTKDRVRSIAISQVSVYWVGHSLMEQKSASDWGQIDLMSLVGIFAKAKDLGYHMADHTLWGTPLSGQWSGRPHIWNRDASQMVAKREAFEREAGTYDTLVLTEGVPVTGVMNSEFSAYYLRRFYCTLKQANPKARVFLYQSWVGVQSEGKQAGQGPAAYHYDWRAEMARERAVWLKLAEAAARPDVRMPNSYRWLEKIRSKIGWASTSDAGCKITDPIFIVPVGDTLTHIADRLTQRRGGDHFFRKDGSPFRLVDLFANPYINWPAEWPLAPGSQGIDEKATLERLKLRDPAKPHDPIHSSLDGIYVAALVHFAALYRQSPVGLPYPDAMGEGLARTLQCIAWQTVTNTPQSGVSGEAGCDRSNQ